MLSISPATMEANASMHAKQGPVEPIGKGWEFVEPSTPATKPVENGGAGKPVVKTLRFQEELNMEDKKPSIDDWMKSVVEAYPGARDIKLDGGQIHFSVDNRNGTVTYVDGKLMQNPLLMNNITFQVSSKA